VAIEYTHSALTDLAVKWLKRPASRNGPGCHVALSEVRTGWSGEIPDAIGFRASGHMDGSTVVEVKVGRGDFLADRKKDHRQEGAGVGRWRYFMCPEGLISPEELPPKWGLLHVTKRGGVKVLVGALAESHYGQQQELLASTSFNVNCEGEQFILISMLRRVGDPEALNLKLRKLYQGQDELQKRIDEFRSNETELLSELRLLKRQNALLLKSHSVATA
tara:strand:- start:290 stop:946 length:657 start_codon:yes stop_codon:yes gene_type:complete